MSAMGSDVLGPSSWPEVESWTPVHRAVEMSDYETLTALLDSGADPDDVCLGHTLLTHAIGLEGDGHVQTNYALNTASTAILLAYGADPRLSAIDGETPLQIAEYYHHEPIRRLLHRFLALPGRPPRERA
ncbi:ankyrin repeat domain-containing protein [Streptomyces sp. NPDC059556]|uniref:ankyrin repeat domain-containing protein n=1 Tax=Streptomyces sp. NPDC059556 TaxID=3346863 RepID=UPI0036BB28F0